jgi:hypothetical protein
VEQPEWQGFCCRPTTETGDPSGGRWDGKAGAITRRNVWKRAVSFTIFLRSSLLPGHLFDESLGVGSGTPWGAGEETDFILSVMDQGASIYYDPALVVHHPRMIGSLTSDRYSKALSYGRGMGRVLRKNRYPLYSVAYHLIRPFGGTLIAVLTGRTNKARYHWSIFTGRFAGWLGLPSSQITESSRASAKAAAK